MRITTGEMQQLKSEDQKKAEAAEERALSPLGKTTTKFLELVRKQGSVTTAQASLLAGCTVENARTRLVKLTKMGLIVSCIPKGHEANAPRVYKPIH